jgi:hypothetical protein
MVYLLIALGYFGVLGLVAAVTAAITPDGFRRNFGDALAVLVFPPMLLIALAGVLFGMIELGDFLDRLLG